MRAIMTLQIARSRMLEWLLLDYTPSRRMVAWVGLFAGLLMAIRDRPKAFTLLSRVHSSAFSPTVSRILETLLRYPCAKRGSTNLERLCHSYIRQVTPTQQTQRFFDDPRRMLRTRILVLKSYRPGERGVIVIDYNFTFPLFLKEFRASEVAKRDSIVLEPSWRGYFCPEVLSYTTCGAPVFVETGEPQDMHFLQRLGSNLIPVPVAGNWWVDHRVFRPLPDRPKDADVIMVAGWTSFKRHEPFFRAVSRLRKHGKRLKIILVGYPSGLTRTDIFRLAKHHDILDQVEMFEKLDPSSVNEQYNRARVKVLGPVARDSIEPSSRRCWPEYPVSFAKATIMVINIHT